MSKQKPFSSGQWSRKQFEKIKKGEVQKHTGKWPFILVGQILQELADEGLFISRPTFNRLEKAGLFKLKRTVGGWRVMNKQEANAVKKLIWINYTGLTHKEYVKQQELEEKIMQENG